MRMIDRKITIENLEQNIRWIEEIECHQFPGWGNVTMAMRDAAELLKEQEVPTVGAEGRWTGMTEREKILNGLIDFVADLSPFCGNHEDWKKVNNAVKYLKEQEPIVGSWVSVKDRLPENAKHPGEFCPKYLVYTDYGITEGWYNPDKECWYGFLTFMTGVFGVWNIDLEGGDIPKRVKDIPVKYWMPLPKPPEEEKEGTE